MDELDRRIISELQNDFPIAEKPYDIIAQRLGVTPEEVWAHVKKLSGEGVIRRVGISVDSRKFGFVSTLAAVRVEKELVEKASKLIAGFSEVTHSYLRDGEFNLWFTVIAENEEKVRGVLEQIQKGLSLDENSIMNLPMKRMFKLDTRFEMPEEE